MKKKMTGDRLQKFLASRDIDDAYDIGAVLGRGAYSVVKTAKSKKTNDEVRAVPELKLPLLESLGVVRLSERERGGRN